MTLASRRLYSAPAIGQLLNAVLFQLTWFGAVAGAARGEPAWGLAAFALLAASALTTAQWRLNLVMACICASVGLAVDSHWRLIGWIDYGPGLLAPAWIVLLWAAVGLCVNHSLRWLRDRPIWGAVSAGAAAPLSYVAAERLGALELAGPAAIVWIALAWMLLFGAIFTVARSLADLDAGHETGSERRFS